MYYFENDLLEHFPRNLIRVTLSSNKKAKTTASYTRGILFPSQIDFTFHIKSIHKNVSSGVRRNGQRYPPFRSKI